MTKFKTASMTIVALTFSSLTLAGCKTTPEVPIEVVQITPPVVKTCTEISALTRAIIPAVTKVFFATTEIENPGYEPIQRTEKQVRVIKEAETIFVDSQGREVTDICDTKINPDAPVEIGRTPGT